MKEGSLTKMRRYHFLPQEGHIFLESPPGMWFELPWPESAAGAQSAQCPQENFTKVYVWKTFGAMSVLFVRTGGVQEVVLLSAARPHGEILSPSIRCL